MISRVTKRTTGWILLVAVLSPVVSAQWKTPQQRVQEELLRQGLRERMENEQQLKQQAFPFNTVPGGTTAPLMGGDQAGLRRMFPNHEGLPTYPNNVPGFGGYPGAAKDPSLLETPGPLLFEKPPVAKDRWPSWVEGGGADGMKSTSDQAVLVRVADRVWFRAPDEPAYVPLAHYDRFRFMRAGTQIDVRGRGEYQVVLHAGGRLRSRGPCALDVVKMDEEEVAFSFRTVDRVWLSAALRPVRATFPDGTEVTLADSRVYVERQGDRCHVSNLGKTAIRLDGPGGKRELPGLHQVRLWMHPAVVPQHSQQLEPIGDVATTREGEVITVRGAREGRVVWSGALFQVGAGKALELRPLPSNTNR